MARWYLVVRPGRATVCNVSASRESVVYEDRLPTAAEFHELFEAVGWPSYEPEAVPIALAGSLLGVVAHVDGEVAAMGRVVGDGGKFFYVQDVVVRPKYQGHGVGRETVTRLLDEIERIAPGAPFVGVFATPEAIPLYREMGLVSAFGGLTGMAAVRQPPDRAASS